MSISTTTVLSRSYFSLVSRAKALKVCFHLVRWSFLLANWFCGLKATRLLSIFQPNQPDRTWCIVPTYSLCSCPKNERGEHEKPPSREECETLLEGKIGPSISLSFSLSPAGVLLTKAADRRVEINSMEPTDESKEEKKQRKTARLYEDFTRRKSKNNPWLLAGLPPEEDVREGWKPLSSF